MKQQIIPAWTLSDWYPQLKIENKVGVILLPPKNIERKQANYSKSTIKHNSKSNNKKKNPGK